MMGTLRRISSFCLFQSRKRWTRVFLALFFVAILLVLWSEDLFLNVPRSVYEMRKKCYTHEMRKFANYSASVEFFEDLISSSKQPKPSQAIFFVSSNCSDVGLLPITQR